jgi:hypothetical protein
MFLLGRPSLALHGTRALRTWACSGRGIVKEGQGAGSKTPEAHCTMTRSAAQEKIPEPVG